MVNNSRVEDDWDATVVFFVWAAAAAVPFDILPEDECENVSASTNVAGAA